MEGNQVVEPGRADGGSPGPVEIGSPAMFEALVESSVSPFVVVDPAGFVRWCGRHVESLLGEPASAVVGRHFLEAITPESHEVAIAAFSGFVESSHDSTWIGPPMLLDLVRADGSHVTCEVSAALGAPHGLDGAILQVRRWRGTVLLYEAVDALAAGAPLEEVLGRLLALLEHDSPGSVATVATGWDGEAWDAVVHAPTTPASVRVLTAAAFDRPSPAAAALARSSVAGLADLDPAMTATTRLAGFSDCWVFPIRVGGEADASAVLVSWRPAEGAPLPHLTTTASRVARLVALAIESSETRATWRTAAYTDDLTGLASRAALDEHLASLDDDGPRSVLFCDLDGFKAVNDDLGHEVGDRVLQVIAERIRSAIRPEDLAIRWGGDEFAVVCVGTVDPTALAERIIDRANEPIVIDGARVTLGISIGVATSAGPSPVADLLRQGDDALRAAKSGGKNRWLFAG